MTATVLAAGAALAAGYVLGRIRPWDRLDTWVWRRFTFMGDWTKSKPQLVITIAAHILVRPRVSYDIWRRRNEPPKPVRAPALRFRDTKPEEPTP
ncbi:hypothetical protein GPZ77_34420 (plasmid) [Streptomyces sp. QHH-9511]|uniref:hypothetical protein n=1 Tax=Streptomyces sp. QHH-9511 TaxID=2684468 RepID=UPI001316D79C|nr:hypothetical protein [Streptomyces sp. QHH-9511]QGZ53327.1 hypothetical protein GPZ77_34420 [Streptomyces sp. QHH-9511]